MRRRIDDEAVSAAIATALGWWSATRPLKRLWPVLLPETPVACLFWEENEGAGQWGVILRA